MLPKAIIIYDEDNPCTLCEGWKCVDNGEDPVSWKSWAELPAPSNLAVQIGLVRPVVCPRCEGTGIEPQPEEEQDD